MKKYITEYHENCEALKYSSMGSRELEKRVTTDIDNIFEKVFKLA